MNTSKTCACQGMDESKEGMSYTFGCSWNCYHNMCKFAKSVKARKYHLTDRQQVINMLHPISHAFSQIIISL
jgi:hypothetical protein